MNKFSSFFAAYNDSVKNGNTNTKEETILAFTNGRTKSLKDLSDFELKELIRSFRLLIPQQAVAANNLADRMRKSIIAIFKSMDRTVQDAKDWAEKQGVKGVKKDFNDYTTGELYVLINIAEKIKMDWSKSIRKQFTIKMKEA